MKNLATIERILDVYEHPDKETLKLECVKVLGYQCIVPKGIYATGNLIIYIKPDSVLPDEKWSETFKKYAPKRIKAIRLRGAWSEGLIIDVDILKEFDFTNINEGVDVTDFLKIKKWESPIPNNLDAKGWLPLDIPMTDEERWENIVDSLPYGEKFDMTLKVDGQSCSFYYNLDTETFGVTGRKLELKEECVNKYTIHIEKLNIREKLISFCKENNISLCIRGESYGQGIQTTGVNTHSKMKNGWKMFSVWNIKERKYERKGDKFYIFNISEKLGLPTVELLEKDVVLTKELIKKFSEELIEINGNPFEGVVLQGEKESFKIINKFYDSKK